MPPFPNMMLMRRGGPLLTLLASGNASASRSGGGVASTNTVITSRSGGLQPFTYAWTRVSGDVFTPSAPTGSYTDFSIYLSNGASASATYRCTVTSADNQTASVTVSVSAASSYVPLSLSISPNGVSYAEPYIGSGDSQAVYTPEVVANATGGTGSYSYRWNYVSGPPIAAVYGDRDRTRFIAGIGASGISHTAYFNCEVSDGVTTVKTSNFAVTIATT